MNKIYTCICGKTFDKPNSFNGHKCHCKEHLINTYGEEKYLKRIELDEFARIQAPKKSHEYSIYKKEQKLNHWISEQHTCEKCGKIMTEKYGSGRFCSKTCAHSRVHTPESKQKISNSLNYRMQQGEIQFKCHGEYKIAMGQQYYNENPKLCPICNSPIPYKKRNQKTCSPECGNKLIAQTHLEQVENGTHKGWISRDKLSYAESFWKEVLDKNNISYKHNYPIHNDRDTYYYLDFFIDDHIDLEIDGKQHLRENHHIFDQKRNKFIKSLGYEVYRIPWISPKIENYDELIQKQINDFIDWYNNL